MRMTTKLRQDLREKGTVWFPGAYDAMSARMIEATGFDGVLMSGFGVAASLLGQPDVELYTMTENLMVLRNAAAILGIPMMADADTGYGNAINVMRTVREFEAAGVASITIEDQISPKKCPALSNSTPIVPIEEAVAKIRAAVAARRDPDLIIIARTDARDEEEILRRGLAYVQAGADLFKPLDTGIKSLAGFQRIREACKVPLALSLHGWLEDVPVAEVEAIGGIITVPLTPILVVAECLRKTLTEIKITKSVHALPAAPMAEKAFKSFIGFDEIERLEKKFIVN